MKLSLENLGRIESAEIDVRPFTVFIGQNNTNKTWTAYALYGILRPLTEAVTFARPMGGRVSDISVPKELLQRIKAATSSTARRIEESQDQQTSIEISRTELLDGLDPSGELEFGINSDGIARMLNADADELKGASARLMIPASRFLEQGQYDRLVVVADREQGTVTYTLQRGERTRTRRVFGFAMGSGTPNGLAQRLQPMVMSLALAIFGRVVPLPAERKAFVGYFDVVDDALSQRELGVPAKDFLNLIRSVRYRPTTSGTVKKVLEIFDRAILGGTVDFEGQREERLKSPMQYSPDDGPKLEMQASASLIRSLAGLELYLRMFAKSGDVLIIDEPEMNAHPKRRFALWNCLQC